MGPACSSCPTAISPRSMVRLHSLKRTPAFFALLISNVVALDASSGRGIQRNSNHRPPSSPIVFGSLDTSVTFTQRAVFRCSLARQRAQRSKTRTPSLLAIRRPGHSLRDQSRCSGPLSIVQRNKNDRADDMRADMPGERCSADSLQAATLAAVPSLLVIKNQADDATDGGQFSRSVTPDRDRARRPSATFGRQARQRLIQSIR